MEINYKKKEFLICPQIICIFLIFTYISLLVYVYIKYCNYLQYFLFIPIIFFTLSFYYINKGIINKNFKNYNNGLMTCLIFAITSAIFKFIHFIIYFFVYYYDRYDDDDLYRKSDLDSTFFNKLNL